MKKKYISIILKLLLTGIIGFASYIAMLYIVLIGLATRINAVIIIMAVLILPLLLLVVWLKGKRKKVLKYWLIFLALTGIAWGINYGILEYKESLRIKTDININIHNYMPFEEESKIAGLEKEASLKLKENLPRLDGAAAVFPLYSAFVNAVYPENTKYDYKDGSVFSYHNTVEGYKLLAEKKIDIFFGAYPSEDQLAYAKEHETEFEFTEIGKEGFVFFVNKNNPVESLTEEQIRDIYSGKITNWKEVGGKDEEIQVFQRNEGSGSQSRLKRFMGDTPLMKAETEKINAFMGGIIEQVADYKNYSNSIGFSFRYYLETLIANPNVKMLKVNGIAPTPENISNETYPLTGSLYAVTYKDNENANVDLLIDWIISEEGQEIVEKTGYSRVK